jgi:hypothetical protein
VKGINPGLLTRLRSFGLPKDIGEAAGRFGPDLAFSALYASTVPQDYANGPERLGLFAEDFASQAVPGILAAGLGGVAARRFGASTRMAGQIAGYLDMGASIAAPMAAGPLGLRPMSRHLDERAMQNAELQAELERQGIFEQGLMAGAQRFGDSHMIEGIDSALAGLYG